MNIFGLCERCGKRDAEFELALVKYLTEMVFDLSHVVPARLCVRCCLFIEKKLAAVLDNEVNPPVVEGA